MRSSIDRCLPRPVRQKRTGAATARRQSACLRSMVRLPDPLRSSGRSVPQPKQRQSPAVRGRTHLARPVLSLKTSATAWRSVACRDSGRTSHRRSFLRLQPDLNQAGITASDRAEWLQTRALAKRAFPPVQHHAVLRQQRNLRPTIWCFLPFPRACSPSVLSALLEPLASLGLGFGQVRPSRDKPGLKR